LGRASSLIWLIRPLPLDQAVFCRNTICMVGMVYGNGRRPAPPCCRKMD
jgi:hypothetical protein